LSTGSSIMPQKKNPDVPELVRGKTGRIYGHLVSLLTTMKGLPLSYNRDLQEDKEPLFDTVETLSQVLAIMALLISRLEFNRENMRKAADDPFVTATDLADHLVRQGVPFRQAHAQVGALVRHLEQNGLSLSDIDETELARFCPRIKPGVKRELTLEASVAARITPGGAAPARVISELEKALKELES